ncbi:TetR/AcrR family transcriptional regulator [Myceligenerans crystallogenes]|uniref:TetR/AcrR family transcriptional regulator n=1 Tax=Myceligenerans crystallogenes TaxID=316335 RepID=A0ABP4ZSQ9_9MICO
MLTAEQKIQDRRVLLDVAERLIYARGVHEVSMDEIRDVSGRSLKRIYANFPTKEALVVAMLRRRDQRWRSSLAQHVESVDGTARRVDAIFEWLRGWFSEPGFRGCAWINIHGELGSSSAAILEEVRSHKAAFRKQVTTWAAAGGPAVAEGIFLLAEGAIVAAAINSDPGAADTAREAAERLLAGSLPGAS